MSQKYSEYNMPKSHFQEIQYQKARAKKLKTKVLEAEELNVIEERYKRDLETSRAAAVSSQHEADKFAREAELRLREEQRVRSEFTGLQLNHAMIEDKMAKLKSDTEKSARKAERQYELESRKAASHIRLLRRELECVREERDASMKDARHRGKELRRSQKEVKAAEKTNKITIRDAKLKTENLERTHEKQLQAAKKEAEPRMQTAAAIMHTPRPMNAKQRNIIFLEQFGKRKSRLSWKKLPKAVKSAAAIMLFLGGLALLSILFPPANGSGSVASLNDAETPTVREEVGEREEESIDDPIPTERYIEPEPTHTAPPAPIRTPEPAERRVAEQERPSRPPVLSTRRRPERPAAPVAQPPERPVVITYKVKRGDNLWNICKRELGSGSLYKKVGRANGLRGPGYTVKPGMVLTLSR